MEVDIVLVRTEYSGNIGSAARALANSGGTRLILVEPQCLIDEQARQGAAGAQKFLNETVTYADWSDFFKHEGEGYRIALSRRTGKRRQVRELKSVLSQLTKEVPREHGARRLYLIFGPEADGLDTSDLKWVHQTACLPVQGEFKSMNLSHAVLLATYIVREAFPIGRRSVEVNQTATCTRRKPVFFPDDTIKEWITAMGFEVDKRKASAYTTFRRLVLQNWPSNQELHVLEAILQQSIRRLSSALPLKEVPNKRSQVGVK